MKLVKALAILLLLLVVLVFWNFQFDIPVEQLKEKYTNEASQFMDLQGLQVHYRDEGQGMPIVLLHGTAASLHTWDDWTQTLQKQYRVIRLDLPAFGLTGPNATHDYSLENYSNFLNEFLNQLAIDSCYLAGNSLGGAIAWYHAAAYPQRVKKMVLLNPAGYVSGSKKPFVFRLAATPVLNQIIRYVSPKSFIAHNLQQVYFDDSKIAPGLVDRYFELTLRTGNRTAFIERVKSQRKDQTERLKQIQCPTLILWGKEDTWIPVAHGQRFVEDLPNAELVVMEETGHVPMEERPTESLVPVLTFLKKVHY